MSNLKHADITSPQLGATAGQEVRLVYPSNGAASYWALVCGLMLGMSSLASCSDDRPRRENSEMTVDAPPSAPAQTPPTPTANDAAVAQPTGPLPENGRKYQVIVETAYFFDQPVQATPNGRYLRRGDTFYGQGESNGFVRAGFVQPNGASGIAWLKAQGLRKLTGGRAGSSAKAATATQPVMRPPAAQPKAAYEPNPTESAATSRVDAAASSGTTAKVEADRAYFYNSPDLGQPRKAFCQRGDKVRVLETSDEAVRVTFTNWEKVTTTGWMRKDALRFGR